MKQTRVERGSQVERSNSLKHLSEDELLDVFETAPRRSTRDHAPLVVCSQNALRASELMSLRMTERLAALEARKDLAFSTDLPKNA
jgi:hypothetical protein